jgi:hypothetical protein
MLNVFTVDVEDYFHPTEVAHTDIDQWLTFASRIHIGVDFLLEALAELVFFVSMASPRRIAPNRAVSLIYLGVLLLAACVVILGVGLLRAA